MHLETFTDGIMGRSSLLEPGQSIRIACLINEEYGASYVHEWFIRRRHDAIGGPTNFWSLDQTQRLTQIFDTPYGALVQAAVEIAKRCEGVIVGEIWGPK